MKIVDIEAIPASCPVPEAHQVRLGIGKTTKRDTVFVKVITDEGLVGWGEAHHGRCPGAVAKIINTTIRDLLLGESACDTSGVWRKVYASQLASHGMGAGSCIGLSGVDLALWDIRGKACGWPLYKLLGGGRRPIRAYAGGISLGWQRPEDLADEALGYVEDGFTALKLRIGDSVERDVARITEVRKRVGPDVSIMVDANCAYSFSQFLHVIAALSELRVLWLEEPFSALDLADYRKAAPRASVLLAAGENFYTRYEFRDVLSEGLIGIVQPDVSKCGGITEALRIASLGSAFGVDMNPHTSTSGLNMAATIHLLSAIDNVGYFEADVSVVNPFRDQAVGTPYCVDADGNVMALEAPGIGVEVDEDFIRSHPVIDGAGYIL